MKQDRAREADLQVVKNTFQLNFQEALSGAANIGCWALGVSNKHIKGRDAKTYEKYSILLFLLQVVASYNHYTYSYSAQLVEILTVKEQFSHCGLLKEAEEVFHKMRWIRREVRKKNKPQEMGEKNRV